MKIKKKSLLIYFAFWLIFLNTYLNAETIFFDTKNIKIKEEGNLVFASNGTAEIPSQNITIEGDRFIYNKLISELVVIGNAKFLDKFNNVFIDSEKAIYSEIENTVLTNGNTFIKYNNKYEIISKNVLYNRNTMKVSSELDTSIFDKKKNVYNFKEGFLFNSISEIISSKKTNIIDSEFNEYIFEKVKINLKTNEIAGKEVKVDFIDSFFGNKKNDPLLKGKSTISNNEKTIIHKAVFSTCNTEKKKCRGWELQSDEFIHNKTKQLFEYKDSWLKVFDKKVFFLPYFNHPDPSVKRKSGFLTPVYSSSSNLGKSINIPYFKVLSDSKDMTFNPRIYSDYDFILQSEYRQAFEKSNLIADFSFNQDENNTNTHAFLDLRGDFNEKSTYHIQFQNVTNDNYLKIHDFKGIQNTNILMAGVDSSTLSSFVTINNDFDEDTNLNATVRMYEDLAVTNDNDKYQYIFPEFNFSKSIDLDDNYDGNFTFSSSGYQKSYNTNVYEAQVNNDFNFTSFDFFTNTGLVSNYNLLLKNYNTYSENSSNFNENGDHELFTSLSLNTKFPLQKKLNNSTNYLTPRLQFNFSPTNGKDISSSSVRLNYDSIFSNNRIGRNDMVEEGRSLTLGLEFEKQDFENEKIFGFNVGNVIKDEKNMSMPSGLNQTRSEIVGKINYIPNKNINLEYNFSYDRDLDFSNYDAISARLGSNKIITTFNYITDNHELGDSETISNETQLNFGDEHFIQFNTAKNLIEDFTQFYKLAYEYKTDCLSASFEYQKTFYNDGNLVPDASLKFLIRFIPFTEVRGSADTLVSKK
tara:strand:- start:15758 stop:18175 length:2418 start_codon:yes stop_codon:yes gene_type:complete